MKKLETIAKREISVFQNKKILVVDDQEEMLFFIRESLCLSFDCEIDVAESVEEALQLLKKKEYSLLITDFYMPQMNGADFVRHVRSALKLDTPIIVLSGDSHIYYKNLPKNFKRLSFHEKPLDVNKFIPFVKFSLANQANLS